MSTFRNPVPISRACADLYLFDHSYFNGVNCARPLIALNCGEIPLVDRPRIPPVTVDRNIEAPALMYPLV